MLNEALILRGGDPPKIDLVQLREASYAKKYSRLCLLSQNLIIKAKIATFLLVVIPFVCDFQKFVLRRCHLHQCGGVFHS